MRAVALTAALLAIAVLLVAPGTAAVPSTALVITYHEDGVGLGPKTVWTLTCEPARGTHPVKAAACARLASGGRMLFTPIRGDRACTEVYGGPQVALIRGRVDGARVWAKFSRVDGCEIDRWQRIRPVLP